jgi:hypothetical protein
MKVAVIGWGSLIWCPGGLRIRTRWRRDGPELPIEFARISRDQRLTLVIHPGSKDQRTYWALSEAKTLRKARENLRERECTNLADIHFLTKNGQSAEGVNESVLLKIRNWLATKSGLDTAIWTGLSTNWKDKRGCPFSPEDALRYLRGVEAAKDEAAATYNRAREYIVNTPEQIQTEVRRLLHENRWTDATLPGILFEG